MLETIKHLTKHSLTYGLGGMLNKLIGFFLLPVYTRLLTPADYGILSLLGVTSSLAIVVAQLGLGSAFFREVIYEGSEEHIVESTTLYFLLGESAIFFGGLIAFSPNLSTLIFGTVDYTHLLRLVFLSDLLGIADVVFMARLRSRAQSSFYSVLSVARFATGILLNLYFIVVLRRGVEGLIVAGLISAALFAALYLTLLARDLRLTFSSLILRRMLKFGIPLVPVGLSSLLLTLADRYFLQHFSTTAELGLYSLGYSIGMVMNLVEQAFQLAWPPHKFAIARQPDAKHQFARILTYYLLAFGFLGMTLSLLAREILVVLTTPKFYPAYSIVPLIALSYIFAGTRHMTNTGLTIMNKMKYVPPLIVGSALLNLGLNYLLIPPYGKIGAAWATIFSYLALVIVQTAVNLRFYYIRYEYERIAKIALIWGATYGMSLLIQTPSVWVNIGLKCLLLGAYPFLLYAVRFYEKEEIAALKGLLQSRLRHWRARKAGS
jgi:O-antigen/teichoic acid export membrane protein